MKSKRNLVALVAVAWALIVCSAAQAADVWAVNAKGDITLNGEVFKVKGGSWFGLEGRHEAPDDQTNPSGAPMELYIGNVFWASSNRTLAIDAKEIKALGFNSIRMPVSPQTLTDSDPQGKSPNLKNTESVRIEGAFTALKAVIKACTDAGLYVLLDMHSCSNYIGWRAGRLDARPPWADANRAQYDYKREDCSCAATGNPSGVTRIHPYDETKWLADLKTLAGMEGNIMGIDIFNEPWDYSWAEWKTLIEKAYTAINSVNPNILIYAQGVGGSNSNQDGTPGDKKDTPYGEYNVNWGENLYEAGANPPNVPKSKLVYSPHTYGPAVCTQPMFADLTAQPECAGLVEDAFGDKKCQIVINPAILEKAWDEHFGYLRAQGYAIAIGEYGGNMDWPNKAETRHQTRYSYLTNKKSDEQWQNAFADYLIKRGMTNSFYWSINPESSDTYGVFSSPFDPISNKSGWGTWQGTDARKTTLLKRIWDAPYVEPLSVTPRKISGIAGGFNCQVSNAGQISYSLPKAEFVSLKVYNVNGRLQSEIISQKQDAGSYSVNHNLTVPSAGSYLVTFKAGDFSHSQMVYLK
jgi:endoglucanase